MFQNLSNFIESPVFDIKKQYANYSNVLKGAKQGEVVTRFPPEPSGYLHIGHLKAALLNYHYAKIYNGRVLLRFDDTNPVTEKDEYVDSIIEDLKLVKFFPDAVSYTSDFFEKFIEIMTQMIKDGKAYCDNTELEKMRDERTKKIESKCRNQTPEDNLKIWEKLVAGDKEFRTYCVRGKISMSSNNGCMRDPVFYRAVYDEKTKDFMPHHRTGTKFKVYPTYDFACPIIDSLEGVTHALRTTEYTDRNEQYKWVQKALGLREVNIYGFARLSMVNTVFSKRKLKWFVETGRVDGWDDPRFPTIRGILKRGIRVETLTELMLEQGPSKADVNMEWDKLWAINRKIIDPIAARYTAISLDKPSKLRITNIENFNIPRCKVFPAHPKTPQLGNIIAFTSNQYLIEYDDAKLLKESDKVTLMNIGNVQLTKITQNPDGSFELLGEYLKDDKDFKNTYKLTWVAADAPLNKVHLVEYDHLLKCKKLEEDMKFEDVLNENTKQVTDAIADPSVKNLQLGQIIQFQRRGFFILDKYINNSSTGERIPELIYIPDGKLTTMTKNITTKIDQKTVVKGADIGGEKEKAASPQKKQKKQKDQKEQQNQQNQKQKKQEQKQEQAQELKQEEQQQNQDSEKK